METHPLLARAIRLLALPLVNGLPASLIQWVMRRTNHDARMAVEEGGTTLALEAIYSRDRRGLFSRGISQGVTDLFWHHLLSQPKSLRNRLKLVEMILEKGLRSLREFMNLQSNDPPIRILNVGGGSARAVLQALAGSARIPAGRPVRVTSIDKDLRAIEMGRRLAGELGLEGCVSWVRGDARRIGALFPPDTFDIAEMVGLLDYFPDGQGVRLLRGLRNVLKPGGFFLLSNIVPNPEMAFVRNIGWPELHYRNHEDLEGLARRAGFDAQPKVIYEPLRVHVIICFRK